MKKRSKWTARPKVVTWQIVYSVLLVLASLSAIALGCFLLCTDPSTLARLGDEDVLPPSFYVAAGVIYLVPSTVSLFSRKGKWSWLVGLALICMGMPSCVCLPVSVLLLVFWVQPATREYFKD